MSGGDGYLTNTLYREIAKMMTDAGISHRVEQGAKHFHVKFEHLGVERTQILHLGPNNKGSTRRKTIIRFRKIVEAERAWRDQQTSPELNLEQPAMSEQAHSEPLNEDDDGSVEFGPVVSLKDGRPTTTSRNIAADFGKSHADVLRSIDSLLKQRPDLCPRNFAETSIQTQMPNGGLRSDRIFEMDRDGFALVAFGFTGAKALGWKLSYIKAFNAMESELRRLAGPAIASIDTDALKANAQLAASAAGGAAKNAVTPHIRHLDGRLDQINARIDDMARWLNGWRKDAVGYDEAILDRVGRPYVATEFVTIHEMKQIVGVDGSRVTRHFTTCLHNAAVKFFSKPNRGFYSDDRTGRHVYWFAKPFVFEFWHQVGAAIYERHLRRPVANLLPFKAPQEGEQ